MDKRQNSLVWPVTAIACATIIAGGVYLGLSHRSQSEAPGNYAAPPSGERIQAGRPAQPRQSAEAVIVYVTRTGGCYHHAFCSYLPSSRIPMELSEAKERYRPCSRCRPPQ